mmetsp:Transcript_4440/g.11352  ORF Transcript_4440/g.11352 Transcript_4440/m.11352 type:complete len:313 (+) Transcript_4440:932-1870(+)
MSGPRERHARPTPSASSTRPRPSLTPTATRTAATRRPRPSRTRSSPPWSLRRTSLYAPPPSSPPLPSPRGPAAPPPPHSARAPPRRWRAGGTAARRQWPVCWCLLCARTHSPLTRWGTSARARTLTGRTGTRTEAARRLWQNWRWARTGQRCVRCACQATGVSWQPSRTGRLACGRQSRDSVCTPYPAVTGCAARCSRPPRTCSWAPRQVSSSSTTSAQPRWCKTLRRTKAKVCGPSPCSRAGWGCSPPGRTRRSGRGRSRRFAWRTGPARLVVSPRCACLPSACCGSRTTRWQPCPRPTASTSAWRCSTGP